MFEGVSRRVSRQQYERVARIGFRKGNAERVVFDACACVCLGLDVSVSGPSGVPFRCLCEGVTCVWF